MCQRGDIPDKERKRENRRGESQYQHRLFKYLYTLYSPTQRCSRFIPLRRTHFLGLSLAQLGLFIFPQSRCPRTPSATCAATLSRRLFVLFLVVNDRRRQILSFVSSKLLYGSITCIACFLFLPLRFLGCHSPSFSSTLSCTRSIVSRTQSCPTLCLCFPNSFNHICCSF